MRVVEAAERQARSDIDRLGLRSERLPSPNVEGWSVLAAGHLLEVLGYSVVAQDGSGSRGVWNKEAWQVTSQQPPAGSTAYEVRLHCRKFSAGIVFSPASSLETGLAQAGSRLPGGCPRGHSRAQVAPDGRCWACNPREAP